MLAKEEPQFKWHEYRRKIGNTETINIEWEVKGFYTLLIIIQAVLKRNFCKGPRWGTKGYKNEPENSKHHPLCWRYATYCWKWIKYANSTK